MRGRDIRCSCLYCPEPDCTVDIVSGIRLARKARFSELSRMQAHALETETEHMLPAGCIHVDLALPPGVMLATASSEVDLSS